LFARFRTVSFSALSFEKTEYDEFEWPNIIFQSISLATKGGIRSSLAECCANSVLHDTAQRAMRDKFSSATRQCWCQQKHSVRE